MDTVHSGCSWHSMQWMQHAEDAVTQSNSGIWWWEHCLWSKKVKPVDTVHSGCSGCSRVYAEDTVTQWNSGKKVKLVNAADAVDASDIVE